MRRRNVLPFPFRGDEASSFGPSDRLAPPADSLRRADELLLLILACQILVEDLDFIICHDFARVNGFQGVRGPAVLILSRFGPQNTCLLDTDLLRIAPKTLQIVEIPLVLVEDMHDHGT